MPLKAQSRQDGRFEGFVVCDGCNTESPRENRASRETARYAGGHAAWRAGFIPGKNPGEWLCEKCRVQAWPDAFKRSCPDLCQKYGIPVPGDVAAEEPVVQPKKPRSPRKKKKENPA